jgi:hypothetical protein
LKHFIFMLFLTSAGGRRKSIKVEERVVSFLQN